MTLQQEQRKKKRDDLGPLFVDVETQNPNTTPKAKKTNFEKSSTEKRTRISQCKIKTNHSSNKKKGRKKTHLFVTVKHKKNSSFSKIIRSGKKEQERKRKFGTKIVER